MSDSTTSNCLFCKIAAGSIPVEKLYEDEQVLAFADLHPQAPTHLLVIPKLHLTSHAHASAEHEALLGRLMSAAGRLARQQGLQAGYRLVVNTGADGGQTVQHLHLHLLGGRHFSWPPG